MSLLQKASVEKTSYSTKMKVFVLKSAQLWVGSYHVMSTTVHCCWPPPHKQECKALKCWALCSSSDLPNICIRCFCQVLYQVARNRHSRSTADVICQCVSGGGEREGNEITPGGQRFGGSDWSSSRLQNSQWSWTGKEKDVSMHVKSFFRGKLKKDCVCLTCGALLPGRCHGGGRVWGRWSWTWLGCIGDSDRGGTATDPAGSLGGWWEAASWALKTAVNKKGAVKVWSY